MRPLVLLALLPACINYELNPKDDDVQADDTEVESDPPNDTEPPPEEECNGVDDDGDGEIDEGFGDVDADGTADCLDQDCEIPLPDPLSLAREECQGSASSSVPPVRPWSWVIEWTWREAAVYSTPAVADLDQDGIPEVVFTSAASGGSLHALDGRNGNLRWRVTGIDSQSGVAIADLDGDGDAEVLASTGSCYQPHTLQAFAHDGTPLWTTPTNTACETYPFITDLQGDGTPEIIFNQYVLNGVTGAILLTLPVTGDPWGASAAADLDLDGVQEILVASDVFNASGTRLFTCGAGGVGSFPHPVNVDSDPEGEVLISGNGATTLCDTDGRVIWSAPHSSYGAPLAVADFDNDGQQEFAFAKQGTLRLMQRDNSNLWTTPIADYSGLAGATSWDIDLDGVPEVIYADENDILVINGANGSVVLREPSHSSVTLAETPAAADVDGDGHGELIYGSNGGLSGLTVIGGADGDWPYAPPVYNQYGYYGHNINADLTVPANPTPPWLHPSNLFRGQPSAVFYIEGPGNLAVAITDVCAASCEPDGLVRVAAQAWNDGGSVVPAGTTIDLYGHPQGVPYLIDQAPLTVDLEPGTSVEMSFVTSVELAGAWLELAADSGGAVAECDETDNRSTWTDMPCP